MAHSKKSASFNRSARSIALGRKLIRELSGYGKPYRTASSKKALQLIAQGADLTQNANGWSVAHWAAWHGFADVMQALVDKGMDVNKKMNGYTPLTFAADRDDVKTVKILLAAGVNVNKAEEWGVTPLMFSAKNGNVTLVKAFLAAGADPRKRDNGGDDVLWHAELSSYPRTNSWVENDKIVKKYYHLKAVIEKGIAARGWVK